MEYYTDKVIFVTGASSGLGEAIVRHLHKSCRCKIVASSRSADKLERSFTKSIGINSCIKFISLDLEDTDSGIANSVRNANNQFGSIDVLINCAGIGFRGIVSETTSAVDRRMMQVDYFGQVIVLKSLLTLWEQAHFRSGHIVQISSVQGYFGMGGRAPYSAAKHALVGFIDSLRAEIDFAGNIKVSIVSPGYIATNHSTNAISGNGSVFSDKEESHGYSADYVAARTLTKAAKGDREIVVAYIKVKLLIIIRYMFPGLCFRILRAKHSGSRESFMTSIVKWLFRI